MLWLVWSKVWASSQHSVINFSLKWQLDRGAGKARALPARDDLACDRGSGRCRRSEPEAGSDRQRPAGPAALGAPDLPADGTSEQIGQLREEGGRTGSKALPASV